MSLLSSLFGGCLGCLAPVETSEPALADPAAAEPASAEPVTSAPTPTIPSPTVLRPELLRPAVGATKATSPRPAPAFVVAPPRPRPQSHRARLPRGWAVDLSGGTSVPLVVGAAAQLEIPSRLLVYLETGALPATYVETIHQVARLGRDNSAAGLVRAAGRRALVVRAAVGVRPLRRRGLEIRGGYTVAALGAAPTTAAQIDELTADDTDVSADRDVLVQSTTHCIHADLGWRWIVREHLLVRAALGYVQSLGARLYAIDDASADTDAREQLAGSLAVLADAGATAAIRTPIATLQLGYRF